MARDDKGIARYWQGALSGSTQFVFVMDPSRRILAMSGALASALGSSADEFVGHQCTGVMHGAGVCAPTCPLQGLLGDDAQHCADVYSEVLQKDLFVTVTPLPDAEGNLDLILHTAADVTERKRVEGALRESEALLRESQRVAGLGHYVFDIPAGTWTSSAALDELFGIDADYERTAEGWLGIVHPEDRDEMAAYLDEHVLGECRPFDRDYRVRRIEDGELRWVHGLGQLELDAEGRPSRMFGVIQDVTQQHEAGVAVQRSARLLEEAERLAHLGSWEWDVERDVTRYSRGWQRIYGVEAEEVPNETSLSFIHPDDREVVRGERERVLDGKAPYHAQYRLIRPSDGAVRDVEVFGEVVHAEAGVAKKIYGASLDVTDRVTAQRELLEREQRLERLLAGVVGALVSTVELRDPYTSGHQNRVAELAAAMARELEWPEERIADLRTAALLHDIGKVVVPSEILTKPARLSTAEFSLIKDHAAAGGRILSCVEFTGPVQAAIVQHHERLDGSGYPAELQAEEIIPEARLLAVADVYEAMTSHRPYRAGLPHEAAVDELQGGIGRTYDTDAVGACLQVTRNGFAFTSRAS